MNNNLDLRVDPARRTLERTGIYVRARDGERFVSADIDQLDKRSLLAWLRSRGGDNPYAEDVVGLIMGHGHLHDR
jgi:hypothetical protein